MIKPIIPANERERLLSLSRYKILDTLPEEEYDNITQLASIICNTPIATITLIDADRQFHKSYKGLKDNQAPRDLSFCAHAINNPNELMIVNDSRLDKRFYDNPFVNGYPNVIFYSGIPLVGEDGFALGTLCVIDSKPHELTNEQQTALKHLGKQVSKLLELRLKNELLESQKRALASHASDMETFAFVASHDLKEPLRMIKAFNELLEKKYAQDLDDNAKKYIRFSIDGASRMDKLIDDLLNYFKVGIIDDHTENIDLNKILNDITKALYLEKKPDDFLIRFDQMPVIQIQKIAIKQIFQNLISNAIKYQYKDVKAEIEINYTEFEHHWEFRVSDNGIGIDQKNLNAVFTIFKRLHRSSEYSGTGIGLAIVKKIVEQKGGKVWVTSELGKGSTFYFTIKK